MLKEKSLQCMVLSTRGHYCQGLMSQAHQSAPPDGVSRGASAGSGPPLRKSESQVLLDRTPPRRIPACPSDSAGNSSVNQLQWCHRWEEEGTENGLWSATLEPESCLISLIRCKSTSSVP